MAFLPNSHDDSVPSKIIGNGSGERTVLVEAAVMLEEDLICILVPSVLDFDGIIVDIGLQFCAVQNTLHEGVASVGSAPGENRNLVWPIVGCGIQTPTERYFPGLSKVLVDKR